MVLRAGEQPRITSADCQCFSGYATLVPMPTSSHHYVSTLKMESVDHMNHSSQIHASSPLEKTT